MGGALLPLLSLFCLSFLKGYYLLSLHVINGHNLWILYLMASRSKPCNVHTEEQLRLYRVAGHPLQRRRGTAVQHRLRPLPGQVPLRGRRRWLVRPHVGPHALRAKPGDCGSDTIECSGRGAAPPATLAEFTLASIGGDDFYDVSLVDGFNVPVLVAPANGSCPTTDCPADLNTQCPPELRVVVAGATVACRSACEAFGTEAYCCSGAHGTPATCAPTAYSRLFKAACPRAYSYAYDDATSTFTCPGGSAGYGVVFCPAGGSSPEPDVNRRRHRPVLPTHQWCSHLGAHIQRRTGPPWSPSSSSSFGCCRHVEPTG